MMMESGEGCIPEPVLMYMYILSVTPLESVYHIAAPLMSHH